MSTNISAVAVAESSFFSRVYKWMAGGLFMTAGGSMFMLMNPVLLKGMLMNPMLMIGLFIVEIGLVVWLSSRIQSMTFAKASGIFCAYSILNGVVLTPIFLVYTGASIVSTFAITAGTFLVFSVYGNVTKRDLTSMGGLCMMGLIGFIIASVVNIFLQSAAIDWIITYGLIAVFLGLIAYDTQRLKAMMAQGFDSKESEGKMALMGALRLYLDFINLFILLLRIFGVRR